MLNKIYKEDLNYNNTNYVRKKIKLNKIYNLNQKKIRLSSDQLEYIKKGVMGLTQAFLQRQTYNDTIHSLSKIF